jgi:hypothetical protein
MHPYCLQLFEKYNDFEKARKHKSFDEVCLSSFLVVITKASTFLRVIYWFAILQNSVYS